MRTYIWTLPTRIFHWMLVLYILFMLITSEEENLLDYHAAFGYGAMILILFRILWGVIGPRYSRFSQWPLSTKEVIGFMRSLPTPQKHYPGHNPAASFVMLGTILAILLTSLSGVLAYGIQEGKGLFSWLNITFFKKMGIIEEMHESFSTLLLLLVVVHLGGIVSDRIIDKESGTLSSIFSGYKQIDASPAKLTGMQKAVAWFFLMSALVTPFYLLLSDTPLTKSRHSAVHYEKEYPLFVEECASCHTLYAPHLLPKRSWEKLMITLADHFGDDASLDESDRRAIEAYLLANSAEYSTKESAYYILNSIKHTKKDIIAISESPYWREKHASLTKTLFDSPEVKSKANCKACHKKFENGIIDDILISLP